MIIKLIKNKTVIVHHHIGYTGSSTFSSSLQNVQKSCSYYEDALNFNSEEHYIDSILKGHQNSDLLNFHTGYIPKLPDKLKSQDNLRLSLKKIQLFRIPEKIILSNYYWNRDRLEEKIKQKNTDISYESQIASNSFDYYLDNIAINNPIARSIYAFSLSLSDFKSIDEFRAHVYSISPEKLYDLVKPELKNYLFIGFCEYMTESLYILSSILHTKELPKWSIYGKSSAPKLENLDSATRNKLRNMVEVDHAIYTEQLKLFLDLKNQYEKNAKRDKRINSSFNRCKDSAFPDLEVKVEGPKETSEEEKKAQTN